MSPLALSVLDAAPVWEGGSATQALRETVALAQAAERLGCTRFWVTEHHNVPALACAATAVVATAVAGATETIRVGSGGVLLPNHAPLAVAEQFGALAALHPGRVDLGVGRAAGTDPLAARLLRRGAPQPEHDDFPEQLDELRGYFAPRAREQDAVVALPAHEQQPPLWLLGSSPGSAKLAGRLGLPYAFAHQLAPQLTATALATYRAAFTPSPRQPEPYAIVSLIAICGESDDHARELAAPYLLSKLSMGGGNRPLRFPGVATTRARALSDAERASQREWIATQLWGGPETTRRRVAELAAESGADELMAFTLVPDHGDRVRSYELLAAAVEEVARERAGAA